MKKTLLAVLLALSAAPAAPAAAAPSCGDPSELARLYRSALTSYERADRAELMSRLFPVVGCLAREDRLGEAYGLKGKYVIVVRALAALTGEAPGLSSDEDVDERLRAWKALAEGRK